jgi:diguanylate cyclase (GGDEF)-like protein/PAS domain S-box-containing protein
MDMTVNETPELASVDAPIIPLPTAIMPRKSSLAVLLGSIDEAPQNSFGDFDKEFGSLIQNRLGVASSLFRALRAKHAPTAHHCLRVALRCSYLARLIELSPEELDHIEIASLLHDIGKIAVPDAILTKPGPLNNEESSIMQQQWSFGVDILSASCMAEEIIDVVRNASLPFKTIGPFRRSSDGNELPIGARILKISDAFDAMTTDHVYRPAMPRERAIVELFQNAGTQFDPVLVREFAKMSSQTEAEIAQHSMERWSRDLSPRAADTLWQLRQPVNAHVGQPLADALFQQRLLDAMHDGVAFIDSSGRILLWNHGAERLTGISPQSVCEKTWAPTMLDMRDREGNGIRHEDCPIINVIRTGVQTLRRVTITHRSNRRISVDIHVIPVIDERHRCYGVTLLIHDASSETHLEERVQNLHEQATTDPLTSVANRAEFERVHLRLLEMSLATGTPCSIIICDIDRFKQINDVYGHQNGDEALISFANLLQVRCRQGDLVARYGGEEFVMLCEGCDNATAARRAEEIRRELAQTPQPALDGKCMTASFGVTELQLGDTTETMIRRADRALYQAKDSGRNRVVQLGAGIIVSEEKPRGKWLSWMKGPRKSTYLLATRTLVANVPLQVLAEKIRGFISDHHAEIVTIEDEYIRLHIHTQKLTSSSVSAASTGHTTLVLELRFREQESGEGSDRRRGSRTKIDVTISPLKRGDRRTGDHRAQQVLASLKSYLIAQDYFSDSHSS